MSEELKDEEKFKDDEADDTELLNKAIELSKNARQKRKLVDPLDEILETNNF